MDKFYEYVLQYGTKFVTALLIFVIGKWAAKFIARIVEGTLSRAKVDKTLASFTRNISYFGILTFVVLAALSKIGIETTSFIAVIGAAGLAVGLALQGSLSNFAAGVLLIILKPFVVDDVIESAGVVGTVREIQIFNTVLVTADKKTVIIPNAKITADKIVIHSRS